MNGSLLRASWFAVRRPPLLVPVAAVLVLVAATAHVQDDGHAVLVLRGVGVLLACAWLTTMDDPAGEVVAASPYPRQVRALTRLAVAVPVVLPTWVLAAVVAQWRLPATPVLGLGLEALALAAAGLAIAAGLRAWAGHLTPSYLAVIGLLAVALGTGALPRGWTMVQEQTWGAPWQAAQVRWAALLLLGVALLAAAARDPLNQPRRSAAVVSARPRRSPAPPAPRRGGSAAVAGSGPFAGSR